ncbi:MAG TPA: hypothetical protein VLW26_13375 [Steroidobacteraceae bacterium]|nr:hypothetical protein [Steroidobacteraceae bacterium]
MFQKLIRLSTVLGLVALAAATQANAGCADNLLKQFKPNAAHSALLTPALYRGDAATASFMRVNDYYDDEDAIVGLWEFQLSGFLTDFGTQAFHAGGTETMFSAGVDPSTGDVCQGVWRRVGPSTFTLSHIAMAWGAPGTQYATLIHFHMTLHVSRSGNGMTGSYKVYLFHASPTNPFDESAGAFLSGSGALTANRVKPD